MVRVKTAPGQDSHARFPVAFVKDMLRSWLHSWKRFLAIGLISALGVAVLTGIWAGCQDMYQAADRFYKAQGLYDVQVVSSSGLTDDDLQALRRLSDVSKAQAEEFQKAQTTVNGSKKELTLVRLHSHGLNQPYLQAGRLPQSKNEVAVTQKFLTDSHLRLGGHIQLEDDHDASQTADNTSELTIIGTVLDPQDLVNPRGRRAGGFRRTTTSDYRLFLPNKAPADSGSQQQKPVYAAISLRMQGSEQMDTFRDDYEDAVNRMTDRIARKVQPDRQEARHQELVDNVKLQLEQARRTGQFPQAAEAVSGDQTMPKTAGGATTDPATLVPPVRWYLNSRATSGSYSDFKSDIDSIQSLGRAFPVIFLTVAVLMSLTAMTRMVEEERGLIGTYLALGYGRIPVALRYLLFALLACLIGGGLGNLAGFIGIPAFLLTILRDLYVVPGTRLAYDWAYGSFGVALFAVGVLLATAVACANEMRQMPAQLMLPKAPKAGARIFLEKIGPLWRRMSFLNKVTARNLFRFKGRMIMTVGGVAGCTALILCGLAISDTVDSLGPRQFHNVYRYNLLAVSSQNNLTPLRQLLQKDGRTRSIMPIRVESSRMTAELPHSHRQKSEAIQLVVVPKDQEPSFSKMVNLRSTDRRAQTLHLSNAGPIVSQSAAHSLGLSAGSAIRLLDKDMNAVQTRVAAVSRSLIGSDVYLTADCYQRLFDKTSQGGSTAMNAVYALLTGSRDQQVSYVNRLSRNREVASAVSTVDMERSMNFDLMYAVVILIVALAGGLALAVLFTLSSTNVSERTREIATLKVLGFHDREVHTYINKEMLILTLIGILLGLPLGRYVAGLLTSALNMPSLYFDVQIKPVSCLIAAAATMVFALVVQFFTNPTLDRIDPVSALKSVE